MMMARSCELFFIPILLCLLELVAVGSSTLACTGGGTPYGPGPGATYVPAPSPYQQQRDSPAYQQQQQQQRPNHYELATTPKSKLPQLINADGSLSQVDPITPLTPPPTSSTTSSSDSSSQQQGSTTLQPVGIFNRIRAIRNRLSNAPSSLSGVVDQAANQVNSAFREAGDKALDKLKEAGNVFGEKFESLYEEALQIFGQGGLNEKQRWDQLVRRVETSGFADADKQDFYQKIASIFSG